jgi:hypothetical protein
VKSSEKGEAEIIFLASLSPIQSSIRIGQDGMRIQLDVPETEMGNAIRLMTWRDKVLQVKITVNRK